MYLVVDMTSQEGGAKHQVSIVTGQDGVTTERGLLIGQQVDSILVWWFTSKKKKVRSNIHLSRTSLVLIFLLIPSKSKRNVRPRKLDLTDSQK